MVIVNTTFCLHPEIKDEVLSWIKSSYIPSAKKCGAESEMLTRVLVDAPDGTLSYALHITFPTLEQAQKWNGGVGDSLRHILAQRYGERALTFHTLLEIMNNN